MMEGAKISKIKRNFGEITSDQDFKDRCTTYKKGCAIGLLPALQQSEYESDNFKEHVGVLAGLDSQALSDPIFYSWVNVTCHPEWLKYCH